MVVVGCQPLAGESMRWIKDTVSGLGNPHDAAAKNRVAKMEKYVLQGGDVNKQNKLGDTPLHEACAYIRDNGDSSKVKRRKGAGKDRRKVGKKLSRRKLGEGGALEMLELLINAGSNINAQNIVGDAPLHKAALNGRALSADFLIRAGANVNIRNEFAQTPLHAACVSGNIEVVQRLVQGGADTNAQDAAEDTPFHEACRHQYEGIVIYLMGLVNNPETSQGLKLWQGLDPSWEEVLRSKAQAQAEDAEGRGEQPATVATGAAAGLSTVRLGVSTPSTTHNSMRSSESGMGLGGLASRTPVGRGQRAVANGGGGGGGGGGRERDGVTVSSKASDRERRGIASSPGTPALANGDGGGGPQRGRRRSSQGSSDAAGLTSGTSGSRPGSTTRRRRRETSGDTPTEESKPRSFSTGAADVLDWQATKAKSVQQERLIDKAREALREEQHEAAMAMSSTTLGDDDVSVDTLNTADTPTTVGSRSSRPRDQRSRGSAVKDSPAAAAAAAGLLSGKEVYTTPGSRRVTSSARGSAGAGTEAGATPAEGKMSPLMPTPPPTDGDVVAQAPPREGGRRQSARKRSQVITLRSPVPRVPRRSAGGVGSGVSSGVGSGFFTAADDADGSISRPMSRRSTTGSRRSDRGPEAGGGAEPVRRRSTRRREGGEGSSRERRHRQQEGDTADVSLRYTPRRSSGGGGGGGSSTSGRHRSSRGGEGGERPSGSGSSSRRRSSRSGHQEEAVNGDSVTAAAAAAVKSTRVPHEQRTPRTGDAGPSARSSSRGTPSGVRERERRGTPSKSREGRERRAPVDSAAGGERPSEMEPASSRSKEGRERRTPAALSPAERSPGAAAPKQGHPGQDLRPPTWASDVPSALEEPSSRKVIASDLPARRISPYKSGKRSESPSVAAAARVVGGAAAAAPAPAPKQFFSSPSRPAPAARASRPSAKKMDLQGGDSSDTLETVANGSSLDPASRAEVSPAGHTAAAPAPAPAVVMVPPKKEVGQAKPLANGGAATAPRGAIPPQRPTSPTEEFPPPINALSLGSKAADGVEAQTGGQGSSKANGARGGSPPGSAAKEARRSFNITAALAKSKSLLFSDSDTDNDRSSSGEASQQSQPTLGDKLAASAMFRVVGGSKNGASASAMLSDMQVEAAMEGSADSAASTVLFNSNRDAAAAAAAASPPAGGGASPEAPLPPPPPPPPSTQAPGVKDQPPSYAAAVAAVSSVDAGVVQAGGGGVSVVEPSAPPRISVKDLSPKPTLRQASSSSSTKAEAATAATAATAKAPASATLSSTPPLPVATTRRKAAEGAGGRGLPSALGRPGTAAAKVTVPIAGGRAAWDKFLATSTAAPGENADSGKLAKGVAASSPSADKDGQARDADVTGEVEEGGGGSDADDADVDDRDEKQAAVLAAKGPRGFKDAAASQEGPNKGPAGAFSGNAMWRLAAGSSAAANRARSGIAANGHGGYSNPLAALRAGGGNGGGDGSGAPGGGAGAVANPLAGLRGASSMGGAGVANPLPSVSPPAETAAAATSGKDAVESAAEAEAEAGTPEGGGEGRAEGNGFTQFRAISSNGAWPKGGAGLPPRRSTRRPEPEVEADPGQAKVGGLVTALQNPADLRAMLRRRDPPGIDTDDTTSTSSWANLGEQGLVSLHRAKYSPRTSASSWRA